MYLCEATGAGTEYFCLCVAQPAQKLAVQLGRFAWIAGTLRIEICCAVEPCSCGQVVIKDILVGAGSNGGLLFELFHLPAGSVWVQPHVVLLGVALLCAPLLLMR